MTTEEQRLTGENKVLRDLLKKAGRMIDSSLDSDEDIPGYETSEIVLLVSQIHDAVCGAPADLLES